MRTSERRSDNGERYSDNSSSNMSSGNVKKASRKLDMSEVMEHNRAEIEEAIK